MPFDVDLILDAGQTLVANGNTTAIQIEGGWMAWLRFILTSSTGIGTSVEARFQCSVDKGSNYYKFGQLQTITVSTTLKELAIPVYIPRPTTAGDLVYCRMNYTCLGGGSPSYVIAKAFLEPMLSPTVRAIDEQLGIGAALLLAST